ncbi:MAG: GNAT family N-acetyltransferase [Pikeienuella sp.]
MRGLPEDLRTVAAELYLEAFGQKLGPILGRDDRAAAFLAHILRPSHAIVALGDDGQLLGLAGFHDAETGLVGGSFADLSAVYGFVGAAWRAMALSIFERTPKPGEFLMDGIAVAAEARGAGVGTALLAAVLDAARADGASYVRLDVIDSNPRARALYERTGFKALKEERTGFLTRPFGFTSSTTMIYSLKPAKDA